MRLQLFLKDHTEAQVYRALDDYAKLTGAKAPAGAKEAPEPSNLDTETGELFPEG